METNHNPFNETDQTDETKETDNKINENSGETADLETEEQQTSAEMEGNEAANDFEEKYNELNNKYIRLAADFDNFRKRTVQEKEDLAKYAAGEVLKQLTGVLDTFERANDSLKDIEDCKTVKDSYLVAYKQLLETLKKLGMTEIEALGQPFDPNMFEAVSQIPTDEFDPDCVALVMQKGYKLADRVLRPALVGVAIKKED